MKRVVQIDVGMRVSWVKHVKPGAVGIATFGHSPAGVISMIVLASNSQLQDI